MTGMLDAVPTDDRAAIEALLTEFYWRLDHAGSGSVADLFTATATLVTPRFQLSGREQIATWFEERARHTQRLTRHSWSNLRLKHLGPGELSAEAHLLTAAGTPSPGDAVDVLIGETTDLCAQEAGTGWRFSARRLAIALEGRLAVSPGLAP